MASTASLRAGWLVRSVGAPICALLLLADVPGGAALAASPAAAEPVLLQALILDRALRLLSWPAGSGADQPDALLVVAVLGDSQLMARLRQLMPKARRHGRRLEVRPIKNIQEADGAQMVLLSSSQESELESVVSWARGKPVLLIAEAPGLARRGAALSVFPDGGRIHLELNQAALREARIAVNDRLLSLAELVEDAAP